MSQITILDGDPAQDVAYQAALSELTQYLQQRGHTVQLLALRELTLRHCVGCFGCWVKTPGVCTIRNDDVTAIHRAWLGADLVILSSPLRAGFVSALLKTAVDRFLPLVHPYIELVQGEMAHRHRYGHLPPLGSFLAPGPRDTVADLDIAAAWIGRVAQQVREPLAFSATVADAAEATADTIHHFLTAPDEVARWGPAQFPTPLPLPAVRALDTARELLIIHGSARAHSNTSLLVEHLIEGFERHDGRRARVLKLRSPAARQTALEAVEHADLVLFAMPLYVHAMPGPVQEFFELLERLPPRSTRRVAFLVQQGFYESHHSRWLERHLARLPARWGSQYLGTVIRGGVEGIQEQPPRMTQKLFDGLKGIGETLATSARLDPAEVIALKTSEHLGFWGRLLVRGLVLTGLSTFFWKRQLKENGAWSKRFARPLDPAHAEPPGRSAPH